MVPTITYLLRETATADQSVYTTSSITPTANRVLLLAVSQTHASTGQDAPTVSGGGVSTWTQQETVVVGSKRRLTVFRAHTGSSPTTEQLTITMPTTMASAAWYVVEIEDCQTGGTNGADAVVQSASHASTNGTTANVTLGTAWAGVDNRAVTLTAIANSSAAIAAIEASGFAALGNVGEGSGDNAQNVDALVGRNGASLEVGFSVASSYVKGAIGFEIAGADDPAAPAVAITYPAIRTRALNGGLN